MALRSVKYDGSLNYTWPARVLWEDATGFIWYAPAGTRFTRPASIETLEFDWVGRIWYDRWYAVDASLLPGAAGAAGALDHYYCNIAAPGAWEGVSYRFVDLDLDALVFPDGRTRLLDEDELAEHTARFGYPADLVAAVHRAAEEVLGLARAGAPPFDGALVAYHQAIHRAPGQY